MNIRLEEVLIKTILGAKILITVLAVQFVKWIQFK